MSNRYKISIEDIYKNYRNVINIKDEVLPPSDIGPICHKNDNIESCISDILLASQK
jgi:hypothetical protein